MEQSDLMEQVSERGRGNNSTLERRLPTLSAPPCRVPPTTTCPEKDIFAQIVISALIWSADPRVLEAQQHRSLEVEVIEIYFGKLL